MSLKTFHIVFVFLSILLCAFLGMWELRLFQVSSNAHELVIGIVSLSAMLGLVFYMRLVFKKYKDVSYL